MSGNNTGMSVSPASNVAGLTRAKRRAASIRLPELVAAAFFISIYSSLVYFLFGRGINLLQPNYVYALVYLMGAYAYITSGTVRASLARHMLIVSLWMTLIILMALQFLFMEISSEGLGLFFGRVHFLLTMISMLLILSACARLDFVIAVLGWVIVASCAMNVAEFFFGGTSFEWMSTVPGRAAGLFENSNDSATFISMSIPIVAMSLGTRSRWLFYALTFLGVYLTFSRGGLVSWAVFVAATEVMLGYGKRGWGTRAFLAGLVILGAMSALSYFSGDLTRSLTETLWPYLDANTSARIEFLSNDSTQERMNLLQRGLEGFMQAPFFGQGVGYTHSWEASGSVHNMLVLMLAELGLIGGLWFFGLVATIWSYGRPYGFVLAVMFLVSSLFTHNHFERPAVAMAIAIYLVAAKRPRSSPLALSTRIAA